MKNKQRQVGDFLTVIDPTREAMAKSMSPIPGSPDGGGVGGNPMNVVSQNPTANQQRQVGPYMDQVYPAIPNSAYGPVMPMPVSGKPQNMVDGPMGTLNGMTSMIPNTPPEMQAVMAAENYSMRGVDPDFAMASMMGPLGLSPIAPGGSVASNQQTNDTLLLQNTPQQQQNDAKMQRKGSRSSKGMRT
jgi:hypothetical protein